MPWLKSIAGGRLWYEEKGAGCPVIFLHGWCMSSAVWKYQFDYLGNDFKLIAPDLRGHGSSRELSGALSFNVFADDLVALFEELDLSKTVLVGWSMGAQIAMQAYARLADRLAGLVLVAATPRFAASDDFSYGLVDKESRGMKLKVQRNSGRALEGFYSRIFAEGELENSPDALDIQKALASIKPPDTAVILDALDALVQADMRNLLPEISVPTLILNGTLDRICTPQASTYLKDNIPGAEHSLFPVCGHAPFLTQHLKFNDELIKFSRRVCGLRD